MILTKREADSILKTKSDFVEVSLDFGISKTKIKKDDKFAFIDNNKISLDKIKKIKEDECWLVLEDSLHKIAFFSDKTNYYYKLVPTKDWPTVKISSTPMHKLISPKRDTLLKVSEIKPIRGNVLDTCCGLGYAAILISKDSEKVYTFERDDIMIHITKLNPYSRELYTNKNIVFKEKDVFEGVRELKSNFFDRVFHDPPTFKQAPELYTKEFYLELFRVLKSKGILYHYTPWPGKMKDKVFYEGVIKKLKEAGFKRVEYHSESSGVRCVKE